MKVFLHIGVHKTGTTALQSFLAANRAALLRHGILYPVAARLPEQGAIYGHHRLPWSLLRPDLYADPWPALEAELGRSEADVAILSAERLEGVRRDELLDRIRALLGDRQVRVAVYLRRQDEYLHGVYCTRAMQGEDDDFEAWRDRKRPHLDYRLLLERWERAFGREALIVRPYERSQLREGDVVADFFASAGLDLPAGVGRGDSTTATNRSYPKNVIDAFRILRRAGADSATLARFRALSAWVYDDRPTDADVMSPAERAQLLDRFADSNSFVAREYLGRADGVLFRDLGVGSQDAWIERYGRPDSYITASLRDLTERLGVR